MALIIKNACKSGLGREDAWLKDLQGDAERIRGRWNGLVGYQHCLYSVAKMPAILLNR